MPIKLYNCSRQILFENDLPGYEYSGKGTGFICRYCDKLFVVTAHHVVKGYAADALRVLYNPTKRDFVPINGRFILNPNNKDDVDYADLAIFPLEKKLVKEDLFADYLPYALDDNLVQGTLPENGYMTFKGFPCDKSGVDYGRFRIFQQGAVLEGDYIGKSFMARCHEIEIRDADFLTTIDGMSGSPVFWVGEGKLQGAHLFVGVLLRGTHASRRAHYVEGEVLLEALRRIIRGDLAGKG